MSEKVYKAKIANATSGGGGLSLGENTPNGVYRVRAGSNIGKHRLADGGAQVCLFLQLDQCTPDGKVIKGGKSPLQRYSVGRDRFWSPSKTGRLSDTAEKGNWFIPVRDGTEWSTSSSMYCLMKQMQEIGGPDEFPGASAFDGMVARFAALPLPEIEGFDNRTGPVAGPGVAGAAGNNRPRTRAYFAPVEILIPGNMPMASGSSDDDTVVEDTGEVVVDDESTVVETEAEEVDIPGTIAAIAAEMLKDGKPKLAKEFRAKLSAKVLEELNGDVTEKDKKEAAAILGKLEKHKEELNLVIATNAKGQEYVKLAS